MSEEAKLNKRYTHKADAYPSYIEGSSALLEVIDRKIRDALGCFGLIMVWAAGHFARRLLAGKSLGLLDIKAFVDGNPIHHGETIRGVPGLAPEQVRAIPQTLPIPTIPDKRETAGMISERGLAHRDNTPGVIDAPDAGSGRSTAAPSASGRAATTMDLPADPAASEGESRR
jgi:hypothetical protein